MPTFKNRNKSNQSKYLNVLLKKNYKFLIFCVGKVVKI